MRFLYIFPHPDDESFGPIMTMTAQLRAGHEVHLLTLTKGEATRQRIKLGLSLPEMAQVRYAEMLDVAAVAEFTSMTVLDLPDGGLADMDPRYLEGVIKAEVKRLNPDVLVSYPVHGISGFHDHLVTHAAVKRVYLDLKDEGSWALQRLAMFTIPDNDQPVFVPQGFRIRNSAEPLIDCRMMVSKEDQQIMLDALACYRTYQDTIALSGVAEKVGNVMYFEIYGEDHNPPITDLTHGLGNADRS